MEALQLLTEYYGCYNEDGRLRSRHGSVEFLTTMRYIEKYLYPGMRVLEVGAGTGRYSHALAQMGYEVEAVELVQHNIDVFRANTKPEEKITVRQGDARDLSCFPGESFDMTLVLGPMYHLFTEEDQKYALLEALRVTKPGGILCVAYCGNDATMVQFCFGKGKLLEPRYQSLIDLNTFKAGFDPAELFALYRKEDVDALIADLPVERLHYVGTDMATNYMGQTIDTMADSLYKLYLKYHFSICERGDMVGTSHHILDVLRKNLA